MYMFWKKKQNESKLVAQSIAESELSIEALKKSLVQMDDAEFVEIDIFDTRKIHLVYIRTLIDQEKLNESIIKPLTNCSKPSIQDCIMNSSIIPIPTFIEAKKQLFSGSILLFDFSQNLG